MRQAASFVTHPTQFIPLRGSNRLRNVLGCVGLLTLAMAGPWSASAAIARGGSFSPESRLTVTRLCLAGVNAALQAAGKVPPPGLEEYTCSCFLDQVDQGSSIEGATGICRQRAATRFKI